MHQALQENGLVCDCKRMIGCLEQLKNDLGSLIAPMLQYPQHLSHFVVASATLG